MKKPVKIFFRVAGALLSLILIAAIVFFINFRQGIKVKIIHTPGHTPGSSCYIIGDDYLATGDNLVVYNGQYEHFIERFNMNTPEQIKSLTELPDPLSFKYILTGHHGVIKNQASVNRTSRIFLQILLYPLPIQNGLSA